MTHDTEIEELNIFRKGGTTYGGLKDAQEFFEKYVQKTKGLDEAFIWFTEEVGELGRIIRTENKRRYRDGIGDILMWTFSIARMLDIKVADALEYSTKQLVAKGYTSFKATGKIDPPTDPDQD